MKQRTMKGRTVSIGVAAVLALVLTTAGTIAPAFAAEPAPVTPETKALLTRAPINDDEISITIATSINAVVSLEGEMLYATNAGIKNLSDFEVTATKMLVKQEAPFVVDTAEGFVTNPGNNVLWTTIDPSIGTKVDIGEFLDEENQDLSGWVMPKASESSSEITLDVDGEAKNILDTLSEKVGKKAYTLIWTFEKTSA